jgi:hypothetical protein
MVTGRPWNMYVGDGFDVDSGVSVGIFFGEECDILSCGTAHVGDIISVELGIAVVTFNLVEWFKN